MYVDAAMIPALISLSLPRAYMITPNQYEAELLTGMTAIRSITEVCWWVLLLLPLLLPSLTPT